MEFTDSFACQGIKVSPDGCFIAHTTDQDELVVRDFGSLIVVMRGAFSHPVRSLVWSDDSTIVGLLGDRTISLWKVIDSQDSLPPAIQINENFFIASIFISPSTQTVFFIE